MLWVKPNLPLEFDYDEYNRFLKLVRARNPNNKSNIIAINSSGTDLGDGVSHRDVYTVEELASPLINKYLELMDFAYQKFFLIFLVEPGVPVLHHTHKYHNEMEPHFQTIVGLSPDNDIRGFEVAGHNFDLVGHNHFLLNVKLDHYVAPQQKPYMWLTSFCSRMK